MNGPEIATMPDLETAFDEIEVEQPLVGILMSSPEQKAKMHDAGRVLEEADVRYEVRVLDALREPEAVADYCAMARARGLRVLIAGAGAGAALPGIAAAHTDLPLIAVPLSTGALGGIDALLGLTGLPVATVGIDNSAGAGRLAIRIINC